WHAGAFEHDGRLHQRPVLPQRDAQGADLRHQRQLVGHQLRFGRRARQRPVRQELDARLQRELRERAMSTKRSLLQRTASSRLTITGFVLLGAGLLATYDRPQGSMWLIAAPLALLAVNLG